MDKKNTMLLTVIAVATLLVAVVGATFAYFSVTAEGNAGTTSANVTTQKVQGIALSGGKTLILPLTALDMDKNNIGKVYYAVESGTPAINTKQNHVIARVTLPAGSTVGTTYTCTAKVKTTATGVPEGTLDVDGGVYLNGGGLTTDTAYGLATLKTAGTDGESDDLTWTFVATNEQMTADITADVWLKNTSGVQNYLDSLSGTDSLMVNFEFSDFNCNVVAGS